MVARLALLAAAAFPLLARAADTPESLATRFGLTENYTFPVPDQALDSDKASAYLIDKWNLNGNRLTWGDNWVAFSPDPALGGSPSRRGIESRDPSPSSPTTVRPVSKAVSNDLKGQPPVLRVEYPAGSFSGATGGTQFYAQPLNASSSTKKVFPNTTSNGQFERMLLSYDVYFPEGYQFNLGGKLPGLRGGNDVTGCSGGRYSDKCFSSRLMWRQNGLGEVYAYIGDSGKDWCKQQNVLCHVEYGNSLGRGAFSFQPGKWQTVWLYVGLNDETKRNGVMALWFNGVKAFEMENLVIRDSKDISSVGGLYFSTFFGGNNATWATPTQQFSYYRNMKLYAGLGASNATGAGPISGASALAPNLGLGAAVTVVTALLAAGFVY